MPEETFFLKKIKKNLNEPSPLYPIQDVFDPAIYKYPHPHNVAQRDRRVAVLAAPPMFPFVQTAVTKTLSFRGVNKRSV